MTKWKIPNMTNEKYITLRDSGEDFTLEPGQDFIVNEEFIKALPNIQDIVIFPQKDVLERFRHQWILKRSRPHVPRPEATPLPTRGMPPEYRAMLQNVYLRPWTLDQSEATDRVPYICDLDVCATGVRCHRKAWRKYVRGNIVSDFAARIIKIFLLAVMAEGKDDAQDWRAEGS